jgi:hypothetical protein
MIDDRDYALFEEWNAAAEAELGVRIHGPFFSTPERKHFQILDLRAGASVRRWTSRAGYYKPPVPPFDGVKPSWIGPTEFVFPKNLGCILKKRGLWRGWMSPRGMYCNDPHEIVTEEWDAIVAQGLRWETVWAQYWFNRHHFLQARPVAYNSGEPWRLAYEPPEIPRNTLPYRELVISDPINRPNFGLTSDLAGRLLALTARIKGEQVDDGLRHTNVTWRATRKLYNGWILHATGTDRGAARFWLPSYGPHPSCWT